jgi:hypothetical protein
MARAAGITGWHGMRKDELVAALSALPQISKGKAKPPASRLQKAAARNTSGSTSAEEEIESSKYDVGVPTRDLSARIPRDLPTGYGKDRVVLMVRDPYWLHAYWELTAHAIQRAEAAMGQDWHGARPIVRLLDVTARDGEHTEAVVRDIDIHGGSNNWYIEVGNPPRSYRVDIGYLSRSGQFFAAGWHIHRALQPAGQSSDHSRCRSLGGRR